MENGKFREEIIPVSVPQRKGDPTIVDKDENPRFDVSLKNLSGLNPVLGGVCTAGNSSTENDGAAAVVVTSKERAAQLGIESIAGIRSCAVSGVDPRQTHKSVPAAAKKALDMAGIGLEEMDLIEVQEAFAVQVLAALKEMGVSPENYKNVNVNGSGISLGHPIACTGTRILVTLLHEMKRRNAQYALECICGGGGLGIAAVLERKLS